MRGLTLFISDLRNCRTREAEEKRIQKEMGNIRSKFKDGNLDGYQKKKYVSKLVYMYMLGVDIDFGHLEAISLISSTKYTEKQMGYLAVSLLLTENHDLLRLVINSLRKDLEDRVNEINVCLALQAIANIGGKDLAEAVSSDVYRLIIAPGTTPFVKKKAALCLLRLFRKVPDSILINEWGANLVNLLDEPDAGVATASLSLITTLVQSYPSELKMCVPKAVNCLYKIVVNNSYSADVLYYKVPAPWLQLKLLRLLQYYPPPEDPSVLAKLLDVVEKITTSNTDNIKNAQQSNASNAIKFEAINLSIHLDPDSRLVKSAAASLGDSLTSKETNIRYLALETLAHLASVRSDLNDIKQYQNTIIESLKDKDVSVRRQALDLLYAMCDISNVKLIVQELLLFLNGADFSIREDLVLKIAILAEKFATEYSWYIDVMLNLLSAAGDQISNEIWYRVVQITVNHEDLHKYATRAVYKALQKSSYQESLIKVAGYLLGEFGHLIVDEPGAAPYDQFTALHSKFHTASMSTRCLLLNTYIKLVNLFPEIKEPIVNVFSMLQNVMDVELQQRACEYLQIINMPSDELLQTVCEEMPPFSTDKESILESRLNKKEIDTEDKRTWKAGEKSRHRTSTAGTISPVSTSPQDLLGISEESSNFDYSSSVSLPNTSNLTPNSLHWFIKNLYSPQGVLFEDDLIQIGLKSEFKQEKGQFQIFFGNKSQLDMSNVFFKFQPSPLSCCSLEYGPALPISIPKQTQPNQIIKFSLLKPDELLDSTKLFFQFGFQTPLGNAVYNLQFPLILTKFVEPVVFSANDFLARWKQLGIENQKMISVSSNWNRDSLKTVYNGLKLGVLENVDPNPENLVSAGILYTMQAGKIGIL
ncbi:Adaptin/AP-1 alpha/gamma subunit-like protein, partial [Rozella allomycis CSF55]